MIRVKRIYEPPEPSDGYRVLVDRLWPRGVRKEAAALDEWLRAIAPSPELRTWFNHDAGRWSGFQERYREELRAPGSLAHLMRLRTLAERGALTLLYAARDERHNGALVVRDVLEGR